MKCQDVERWIPDWARSGEDAQEPDPEALAHLRDCSRCGEALEEQRRLTEGLAALAMSSRREQAPVRVEESLRAAFRQQRVVPAPASLLLGLLGLPGLFLLRRRMRARHGLRYAGLRPETADG